MKISVEWLRELVPVEASADEIAKRLTMAGFEVEGATQIGGTADLLKVVEITAVKPHPKADKLRICDVFTGSETVSVVCGAPNAAVGMKAIWAPPGTTLPNGMEIQEAAIRGVKSPGMLCSLKELGLEEKSAGIHEFGADAKVGEKAATLLGLASDVVLELNVTPNRGDALSMVGIAREVAALFGIKHKNPPEECAEKGDPIKNNVTLKILDPIGCPRYVARAVRGIRIAPSPAWMQRRLTACGVRAINNIVDVTNYVMLEMGQPLHAFDLDKLAGPGIVVRRSKSGEKFVTLDNIERVLDDDLLICDVEKPVALAGVMGGLNSEVSDSTANVLLEAACFDPSGIRRTSKRTGLSSEASYRFERGVDPRLQLRAANRAISLMAELGGGNVAPGALDDAIKTPTAPEILIEDHRVELYLGVKLARDDCKKLLKSVGLEIKDADKGLIATPPSWRGDINEEADVIEEIARLYGYDRLPVTLPEGRPSPVQTRPEDKLAARIRETLVGAGYHETISLSFMNPNDLDRLRLEPDDPRRRTVKLLNPLSSEESVMRTTLLPSLINAAAFNLKRFQEDVRLFEISRVFLAREGEPLPEEPVEAVGIYVPPKKKRLHRPDAKPFYAAKGAVEEILAEFKASNAIFSPNVKQPYLLQGESAAIIIGEYVIGAVGRLRPSVAESFDISEPVYIFELNFAALLKLSARVSRFEALPVYPPAFRDIAVVAPETVQVADMEAAIKEIGAGTIRSVRVFDVYRGKPIEEGKQSVAFSIVYQWSDKSPIDEEVNKLHEQVARKLEAKFGAHAR